MIFLTGGWAQPVDCDVNHFLDVIILGCSHNFFLVIFLLLNFPPLISLLSLFCFLKALAVVLSQGYPYPLHFVSLWLHHFLLFFFWQAFPQCCLNPESVAWIRLFLKRRSVSSSPSTPCLSWRFLPWLCQAGCTSCFLNRGTSSVNAGTTCLTSVGNLSQTLGMVTAIIV